MTFRFSTTRALGIAALTAATAAAAAAQSTTRPDSSRPRSSTRIPVTKERASTTTTTSTGTVATDTMTMRRDTASVMMTTPAPTTATSVDTTVTSTQVTTVSTGTTDIGGMQNNRLRFGNGFYVGVGGGATFPQNELNNAYNPGFNVIVPLGWDPVNFPLGLRVDVGYDRLRGNTLANTGVVNARLADPEIWSGSANAKLRLPFGRIAGATSGLYAIGGAGVHHFRNYAQTLQLTGAGPQSEQSDVNIPNQGASSATKFSANVGGGLSLGVGSAELFLESRWVRVFTQNRSTNFVPVTLGITLH